MQKHFVSKMRSSAVLTALLLGISGYCAAAPDLPPDNPQSAQFQENAKANRAKIEALMKDAGVKSDVAYFAVRPMSDIMRLGDVYPSDGQFNGTLRAVAAQNEYEPVSFQLFSLNDKKDVTISVSDLKSKNGKSIPARELDVRVIKIWYQNGNRWISYFADVDLRLCPELLLKDENMIKVDTANKANYARIRKNGKDTFEWISAPRGLDAGFDPMQEGFRDADTLQSFTLDKDQFKQFFVTVHVPVNQPEGIYAGTVTVSQSGKPLASIPLKVRVLPFQLPMPVAFQRSDMKVICSAMCGRHVSFDSYKGRKNPMADYEKVMKNVLAHNLFHPEISQTDENFAIIKRLGFPLDGPVIGSNFAPWYARHFGGRLTFDDMMGAKAASEKARDFYMKNVGHTKDVVTGYGDEQGAAFVATHRPFHPYYERYGIRVGAAGPEALFTKGAHVLRYNLMACDPGDPTRTLPWLTMRDAYVGFYANQHTGSENPAYIRRQNGMAGWLNFMNIIFNYEFATGPWNDLDSECYKPMVIAYMNNGGIVDTLQWEGFREAIDDIRYASLLQLEIDKALQTDDSNVAYKTEARKALLFFAQMKSGEMDLDAVRGEMIRFILKLKSMAPKKG